MAKMGAGSKSFGRQIENMIYSQDLLHLSYLPKSKQREFGISEKWDRAVFFAENLSAKTSKELEAIKTRFARELELERVHGIVELHVAGDGTSKSAHVHFWGRLDERAERAIERTIKELRLSNKPELNYTSDIFDDPAKRLSFSAGTLEIKEKEKEEIEEIDLESFEDQAARKHAKKRFSLERQEFSEIKKLLDEISFSIDKQLAEIDDFFEKLENGLQRRAEAPGAASAVETPKFNYERITDEQYKLYQLTDRYNRRERSSRNGVRKLSDIDFLCDIERRAGSVLPRDERDRLLKESSGDHRLQSADRRSLETRSEAQGELSSSEIIESLDDFLDELEEME